jgi:hypothetical protein
MIKYLHDIDMYFRIVEDRRDSVELLHDVSLGQGISLTVQHGFN